MDIKELNQKINNFLNNTLLNFFKNFPKLSLGEQIAYGCIALGVILIIVSLFLF